MRTGNLGRKSNGFGRRNNFVEFVLSSLISAKYSFRPMPRTRRPKSKKKGKFTTQFGYSFVVVDLWVLILFKCVGIDGIRGNE